MPTAALSWLDRPCALVSAAAGWGKTSTVRRLLGDAPARWHSCPRGGSAGAELVELVHRTARAGPGTPRWLVLDDLPRLAGTELAALLRAVDRLPVGTRLVLISRHQPASRALAAADRQGKLARLGPAELALSRSEVATVLRDEYDLTDPALAHPAHTLTGGWPALVHLLARAIANGKVTGEDLDPILPDDDPPGGEYLVREVLPALPADQRRLLRRAAHLDPVAAELCDPDDPGAAARLLTRLVEAGLLAPARPDEPGFAPVPLVAMAVRRALPLPTGQVTELLTRAADWYAARNLPAAALRGYRLTGCHDQVLRLLRRAGEELVATGATTAVVAAVDSLPGRSRPAWLRRLHADALRVRGENAAATGYRSLAGRGGVLPPGVAWRHGLLHYLRGEARETLAVLSRGRLRDERTVDEALLLAWTACAYAMWGDPAACADRARRALVAVAAVPAAAANRAEALLVAHVAAGLGASLIGQPSVALGQLTEASRAARAARDAALRAWARIHLALARTAQARYPAALAETTAAVAQAETAGCPPVLAGACAAEGAALAGLGRLDEAMDRYQRAAATWQRLDSPQVAQALTGIGELHLRRGRRSLARAAYEEAVRVSETAGNRPVLVPALAGLARVTAGEDPAAATALATRALELARGTETVPARVALGWAAVAGGDLDGAGRIAAEATAQARSYHDRVGLAAALELRATALAAAEDPGPALEAVTEAAAIHRDTGSVIDADRMLVLLGRLPTAAEVDRIEARLAAGRLAAAGVAPVLERLAGVGVPALGRLAATGASALTTAGDPDGGPVAVHTLGRFEVVVAGRPVPTAAWQSRKARDLLRILAARRGRPISRDQLAELLWPGEAPERVAHRLSVQLSILRGVLDPSRQAPQDRYVVAERTSVALDVTQVELDVELFRAEASYGLRRFEAGTGQDGADALALAEGRYLGDFLADDPYDDWAVPVRDEARRLYLRVVRARAVLARRRDDLEQAATDLRRALEVEPYDERVHRELVEVLVAAGRHGEAQRARRRYQRAMAVLGVPVQPSPG